MAIATTIRRKRKVQTLAKNPWWQPSVAQEATTKAPIIAIAVIAANAPPIFLKKSAASSSISSTASSTKISTA